MWRVLEKGNGMYYYGKVHECMLETIATMSWTTEPPTEPGLYWYTYKHKGTWAEPTEKRISLFRGELCEEVCTNDGGDYEEISGGCWLGPLPIPEPPEKD